MRSLPVAIALSLLLGAAPSFAEDRPAKPEMKLNVPNYAMSSTVFDFPETGLRIVLQPDPSHDVVTIHTIVNHGSADDPAGKEETAHFCEHAWFRSRHGGLPSVMELLNEIGDIGGTVNASTRNDYTDYTTVAASKYLPLLLKLESLRLTAPYEGIQEAEIDIEREVIRNEFRWRREELEYFRFDYIFDAVYPEGHGYHGASSHSSIDNIGLPDIKKFFDDYYKPDQTTITVIGNFSMEEATHLIFDNFAPQLLHPRLKEEHYRFAPRPGIEEHDQNNPNHWYRTAIDPDSDPKSPEPFRILTTPREKARVTAEREPPPNPTSKEVITRKAPIANKRVMIGWSLPAGYREDHWNLQVLGNLASGYVANGLRYEIDKDKLDEVWCVTLPEVVSSTMMCQADILDSKLDPLYVRDKILDQLFQIWNPENTQGATLQAQLFNADLKRAQMEIMTDILASLDVFASPYEGRATTIGEAVHLTNSVQPQSDAMNAVMTLDPAKISQIGFEYLKRDRAVTVILEPLKDDEIDITSEESSYSGAEPTDWVVHSASAKEDLTDEGIANSYMKLDLSELKEFKLANGLRTVVVPHGEAPLVQASLLVPRNNTAEHPLMFDFVRDFTESTATDPLPIAAVVNWVVAPPSQGFTGYANPLILPFEQTWGNALRLDIRAPSGNLEQALWMLRDQLETVAPGVEAKGRYIKDTRDSIKSSWGARGWHSSNAVSQFLYPGARWRNNTLWEDVDALEDWTNEDIAAYLRNLFQPSTATLVIVGNIDVEEAKTIAEAQFGGWKPAPGTPPTKLTTPAMPTEPSKILVYDEPKKTQTTLSHTCRLNVTDPLAQRAAVGVLSSVLGQQTFNTLRVLEGLAYSPSASAGVSSDGAASLSFGADVVNRGVGRMIQFSKEAVDRVANGGIPEEELALNKLRQARIDGLSAQSLDQLTGQLTDALRAGQSFEWLNEHGKAIAAIEAEDLKTLVSGCNEHTITTLRGPKDVITPQLDELGYTYEVVEWRADGDELLWKYDPKAAKKKEKDKQKSAKKAEKEKAKEEAKGTEAK